MVCELRRRDAWLQRDPILANSENRFFVRPFLSPRVPFASARPRPTHLAATSLDSLRRRHADAPPHAHLIQDDGQFRLRRNCSSSPAVHPSHVLNFNPDPFTRRRTSGRSLYRAMFLCALGIVVTGKRAISSVPSTLVGVTERMTQQRTRRPHETVLWQRPVNRRRENSRRMLTER